MTTLRARPYASDDAAGWDRYVRSSRVPHPMFERRWIEYHAPRFIDASLIVEDPAKPGAIIAVIPASAHGTEVVSHGGLTFGGVLTARKVGAAVTLEVFDAIVVAYRELGFETLRYKAVPYIFHTEPAQEDLYALVRYGATLSRRDLASALDLRNTPRYSKGRKWSLKQADMAAIVDYGVDFDEYITLETEVLRKHGVVPVHSARELSLLSGYFPNDVRLLCARADDEARTMLGGILTITTPTVVHTQYIGGSPEGLARGVVDRMIDHLIKEHSAAGRHWLSFGVSTERNGAFLNEGLVAHKESFGARAIAYDTFQLPLSG